MKRSITHRVGVLAVLLMGATVQAELKLVVNFEGLSGSPDGQACNGVLGGVLDTQSEGTGNIDIGAINGSNAIFVNGLSSGANARAAGFNGITNPIDDSETGIAFFRFMIRSSAGRPVRSHLGLIADATDNPITDTNAQNPMTVPAGFRLVDNGTGFNLVTTDGATVLKAGLARAQWYNVWIVADNSADTFDLYVSKAAGPGGPATLPEAQDLVQDAIPFGVATARPLTGMIFACPAGTGQAERVHVDDIWWDGDQGLSKPRKAMNPSPADRATDVPRDVTLSWTPGPSAATHDVYFGTSLDVVTNASRANPSDVLVSTGQDAATFDPTGVLEFGRTYYWRVDEVNAPPDSTVFKGSVWSFSVEPVSYPIQKVTATASSASEGMGPEKTVDGSGLNAASQHSIEQTQMWLSANNAPQPAWIQYEFDGVYKVGQMLVWNSNQLLESSLGFGAKSVTVEYATDSGAWTKLGDFEFARAPGTASYTANTTVTFGGALAKYVRLTIRSNWGGVLQQFGLSEVRFLHIPVLPREPSPAAAQKNVEVDATLSWRPGREAATHQVCFGTNQQAVLDGTATLKTVSSSRFDPGALNLGTTYFWRITEVNDAATPRAWKGEVWSFTTREYLVVDDFESYTNEEGSRIYQTWVDGWVNNTGSLVGHLQAPFAERTIIHGGKQSMPLEYNNVKTPFYSEAERTWDKPQDWTAGGADTLVLYFRGNPVGFLETAPGSVTMSGGGTDIGGAADEFRYAFQQLSGNGTIIAKVESINNTNAGAKGGVMVRETLDPGSRYGMVAVTPGTGVVFQRRRTNGDVTITTTQTGITAPRWVKLTRAGNLLTAQHSADGVTWVDVVGAAGTTTSDTVVMGAGVYIGLAVTSHNANMATTAQFSNVSTAGGVSGAREAQAIGVAQPANTSAPIYVVVQDSAGRSKVVNHPDQAATTFVSWQQWRIPMSEFSSAGVKMSAVKRLVLGVGDKGKAAPGGTGLFYVDDIGFGHPAAE